MNNKGTFDLQRENSSRQRLARTVRDIGHKADWTGVAESLNAGAEETDSRGGVRRNRSLAMQLAAEENSSGR
jgi:hypothetical protein